MSGWKLAGNVCLASCMVMLMLPSVATHIASGLAHYFSLPSMAWKVAYVIGVGVLFVGGLLCLEKDEQK